MKIDTLAPYHLPHEEILLSIASSVIFKELELQDCPELSLSEVIEQPKYGYTASASHEPVGVKFVRITDIQAGKIDWYSVPYCECEYPEKYLLRENDILFARTGGTTGKSFIVKGDIQDSIFASYLIRIRPKEGVISDFLYWFFQTKQYWSQIVTEKEGSAQPNVNGKKLSSLDIFVPKRSIQEAIANYLNSYKSKVYGDLLELPSLPGILKDAEKKVARIESVMARIEVVRRLRDEAVEEAESLVGIAVLRFFAQDKENGWSEGKIGDYVLDDLYGTSEKTTDDETGTPILRMGNIQHGRLDTSDLKYLHLNEKDHEKLLLRKGDILVNRTNSAELVGKCAVFELEEEYAFASYLIRLRLNTERANPKLVAAYINSPIGRTYMFSERKQMTGQANVNAKKLKAMPIPLPPISEQRSIVAYLDSFQAKVDELKRLQAETEKELEELVPSILDKAFKREL